MREAEPGAQGDQHKGRDRDFTQQGTVPLCLSRTGCWQIVPISIPGTANNVKWPAGYGICLGSLVKNTGGRTGGTHRGAVGSSRNFIQQFRVRGDGTVHSSVHNTGTCLSYSGTPALEDRVWIETSGRAVEGIQGPEIPHKRRGISVKGLAATPVKPRNVLHLVFKDSRIQYFMF